ncbi:MAG TPA: DUF5947 family protein [Streptosporangiaceae bacterium]|nr:DUF5947 family protein [Streptosporangiaceae bacterium]
MSGPGRPAGPAGLRRFVPGVAPGTAPPPSPPATGTPPAAGGDGTDATDTARATLPPFPPGTYDPAAARAGGPARAAPEERCEMCAAAIPAEHGHVADLEASSLLCTCRACYLLFTRPQAGRGRYRTVPDRYAYDPSAPISPAEWDDLEIPVGLAFFLRSSGRDEVAGFYPSPAGATECRLDLAAWQRMSAAHPLLRAIEPDVEAALISRSDDGVEHFLVPIDACYELAGRMRLHWRGFDGGTEARQSIAEFLDAVRSKAKPLTEES